MDDQQPLLEKVEEQDCREDNGSYISPISPEGAEQTPTSMLPTPPALSEDDARLALLSLASAEQCYGIRAADEMIFNRIISTWAFQYQLKTFTEGRKSAWDCEPYTGQEIDGPQNGPAPGIWDIHVQPSQLFHKNTINCDYKVPHTAFVKACHTCKGAGKNWCGNCVQSGRVSCDKCMGTGRVLQAAPTVHYGVDGVHTGVGMQQVLCERCNGTGRMRCGICNGIGDVVCQTCRGNSQLKHYSKLTVTWKTAFSEQIINQTGLPTKLIKKAKGEIFFEDQQPRVAPVTNFPDSAVYSASQQLLHSHATASPTERILMQHHLIRIVPVWKIDCFWGMKVFSYWVYGFDNQVFAPDYPQDCCWCYNSKECTLL